jgi:Glycosyltransferase family 9 (heptosyltransferase)
LSGSISCKESAAALLGAVLRSEFPRDEAIRVLGENCPAEFFRDVVEPLADSFDPAQAIAYERLMRVWIPATPLVTPAIPARVDTVYVLSRVTLGADIKIVSPILATMKQRFPSAQIVFVANRKSAELFAADPRIEHLNADYPRTGPVTTRLEFARELRSKLQHENSIVVDPDSRITQLGLIPVCDPAHYFHFPSRTTGGDSAQNLTDLIAHWLQQTFSASAAAYIAPIGGEPVSGAAVSLGVGDNESKRIGGDFESRLLAALGARYATIWVDRGVGGEEARRVTAAVEASGAKDRVRFCEDSFAGFASIVSQCDLYVGYDSAGQHAAAAARVPLISIFAGAPSERFRHRWAAAGSADIVTIAADALSPDAVLAVVKLKIGGRVQ